jgi:hypothetical protein
MDTVFQCSSDLLRYYFAFLLSSQQCIVSQNELSSQSWQQIFLVKVYVPYGFQPYHLISTFTNVYEILGELPLPVS